MTIKEVEELLGIDRETVRYYIHEGLIAPKQDAKKYRDYSNGDIQRLKIVLVLRQLEVSIAEIRGYLDGELELAPILEKSERTIRQKLRMTNDAEKICKELQNFSGGGSAVRS